MSILIKEGNQFNIPKRIYICDTVLDFQNIPSNIPPYSEAVILLNPIERRVKKEDGSWVNVPINEGGGGSTPVDLSGYMRKVPGANGMVPMFDSDGAVVSTGYTLGKSVPNDAVFTDTTYDEATQAQSGLMSSDDKTKIDELENTYINKSEYTFLKNLHVEVDGVDYVGTIKVIDGVPTFEYEMESD